jgi:hypothetical protein
MREGRGWTTHMRGGRWLYILVAAAHISAAVDAACQDAAAQKLIASAHDVRTALQACWIAPESQAPQQISVRFSFNREGRVVGRPLVTYQYPAPSQEGRAAVREALAHAIARCEPLHLSDDFRKVISVHPISVRLGEGWRRREEPEGCSEGRSTPAR